MNSHQSNGISLANGTILQSRYRIDKHLGEGGMGTVYQALDLRLDTPVAIKQTLSSDAELWEHFEREARLLASLNHPVLPRVFDYFTQGERAFFVMQFVEGSDMAEIIAQRSGPLPRNVVIAWADQLLDAVIYLHSRDRMIIHRDIKPHNLKLTPEGRIVLLDFGLAKSQVKDSDTGSPCVSIFGYTPRYAPLEQIQDSGTSPQSDIYALGATLYHLLTGVRPPDALSRAAALVSAKPNPLRPANEINAALGPELAAILSCAMAQNPSERYQSAREFRDALRRLGRIDDFEMGDYVADDPATEAIAIPAGETTLVKYGSVGATGRLASHAIAALFVILLAAFAVFCCYYPWKFPTAPGNSSSDARAPALDTKQQLPKLEPERRSQAHRKMKSRRLKSASA